jgi:nitroimidazol reductase NimA-like FMN-containing flavoprotein (pyridoxamine 5'-phosphate oxidase superfamily)
MLGELTREEIEGMLHSEVIARLGCHFGGITYIVPITYVYDGESIIGHSRNGMKTRMMRANTDICVEIEQVTNLGNWKSVIAWGKYEELSGGEAIEAMKKLIAHLEPRMISETSRPSLGLGRGFRTNTGAGNAIIYRIRLNQKSGRFERT